MISRVIRSANIEPFFPVFFFRKSPKRSEETEEEAASNCESAVDMVEARIPARIVPARSAGSTPCWLIRSAILTMIVSEAEPSSGISSPAAVMASPMIPISTATAREMTTHPVATLLDSFNFSSSSMAIKRSRICGMPKYPRPHAIMDTILIIG